MSSKIGEDTTVVTQKQVRAAGVPCPECDSGALYSEGQGKRVCDACGTWWTQMDHHPTNWRTNAPSEQDEKSEQDESDLESQADKHQTLDVVKADLDVHEECNDCTIHWDDGNVVAISECEDHAGPNSAMITEEDTTQAGGTHEQNLSSDDEPPAVDCESRVGTVRTEFRREDERPTVVVELAEKELTVAEYCGVIVSHPSEDRLIYFGPHREEIDESDALTACMVTKNTRGRMEGGEEQRHENDPDTHIAFVLEDKNDN